MFRSCTHACSHFARYAVPAHVVADDGFREDRSSREYAGEALGRDGAACTGLHPVSRSAAPETGEMGGPGTGYRITLMIF